MKLFRGFRGGQQRSIMLPEAFFSELLPLVDDLAELKVTLFCFARLQQQPGPFRFLTRRDFDPHFVASLAGPGEADAVLEAALRRAAERGSLLRAQVKTGSGSETVYFANTPQGREALLNIEQGTWNPAESEVPDTPARPNIFQLYEVSIGALTPMIADELKDAEFEYPREWLVDAFELAVTQQKRSWRYVRAILERWNREGRNAELEESS